MIILLIVEILLIIGYFRFKSILSLRIVQRRYPKIVLFESILAIIVTVTYLPLYCTWTLELNIFKSYHNELYISTWVVYPLCHFIVFCEVCRLWLVCYDINYLHSSQNNVWKCQINTDYGDKDWWLKNRATFGNYNYMTKRMAIWGLLSGAFAVILFQTHPNYPQWAQILDSMVYGLPVVLLIYAYYKCPKLHKDQDKFLFLVEFRATTIIYVIAPTMYFISTIVFFFDVFGTRIIVYIAAIIGFPSAALLSTLWIPTKILSKQEWIEELNIPSTSHRSITIPASPSTSTNMPSPVSLSSSMSMNLVKILSNKKGLESFALHLNDEFSLECLLSFIEMMQFKGYFDEVYNGNKDQEYIKLEDKQIKFEFGESYLKSSIVYETVDFTKYVQKCNDIDSDHGKTETVFSEDMSHEISNDQVVMKNFKLIAYYLYRKYIRQSCELEVNIPSSLRMKYNDLMNDRVEWIKEIEIEPKDLMNLFDDVCLEMYKLMEHSYSRFKRTEEYSDVLGAMNNA